MLHRVSDMEGFLALPAGQKVDVRFVTSDVRVCIVQVTWNKLKEDQQNTN
jgi:hypothetical protein